MGKYAAIPNCALCEGIGELCLNCAAAWKAKQLDKELWLLRGLEGAVVDSQPAAVIAAILASLDKLRREKPALKTAQAPSTTKEPR